MSNYEGLTGNGLVTKKDLKLLKERLIKAHNKEIEGLKPRKLKEFNLKKASNRTKSFPIICKYYDDEELYYIHLGSIMLFSDTGKFVFSISENNHAVERAKDSITFQELLRFLHSLPNKGKKYGAMAYYWSEHDRDEYGNKTPGLYTYYGAWQQNKVS